MNLRQKNREMSFAPDSKKEMSESNPGEDRHNLPQILIVDDSEAIRRTLLRQVRSLGFEATAVESGLKAFELLENEKIDLVLLDQCFPGMDGLEIFEKIRTEISDLLPVIMVTAHSSMQLALSFMKMGGADYIEKPVDIDRLCIKINHSLGTAKLQYKIKKQEVALRINEARMVEAQRIAKFGNWEWEISINQFYWSNEIFTIFNLPSVDICPSYDLFIDAIHPYDRERVSHLLEKAIQGKSFNTIHSIKPFDGFERIVRNQATLIVDSSGKPLRLVGVVQDITEQEKAKNELVIKKVALAASIKSSGLKDEFLASMSHELRTPLTSIIGFSERIPIKIKRGETGKAVKFASDVQHSAAHLLQLINDILDFSKIEAGKMELEIMEINVAILVNHISDQFRVMAKDKGVKIVCKIPKNLPPISGDQKRLTQVVVNLLSNAIKFTPKGGTATVSAVLENELILTIEDTGVGIAPEYHEYIFDRFSQTGRCHEEQQGTGLGLAISKQITELHGGKIWVESELGKGSKFKISLPFDK